ncbi:hypothetical protein U8335_23830 [Roseiconus lacunae]|uniref:hypothetical protein n=1 Tax=Roseiconus lacunae TaxID=2605694 RepID=UPI0030937F45|nr:hypothetical protein U8335_23830 [Stieleria sp. HD01]
MSIDYPGIKAAAAGQWREVIPLLTPIRAEDFDKGPHDHMCPACNRNGLHPDNRDGGANAHGRFACMHCGGNKPSSDGLDTILRWGQFSNAGQVARETCRSLGLDPTRFGIGVAGRAPESHGSDVDIVAAVELAKGLPANALKPFGARAAVRNGQPVCRVDVYRSSGDVTGGFDLDARGKGRFEPGVFGMFFPSKLPYAGEHWAIPEGAKDASLLCSLGLHSCGLPGASMPVDFAHLFRGVHVTLVPDLDAAGQDGAQKTASRLYGIAASVRICRLPGELVATGGDDARDVARRHGEQSLLDAINDAAAWEPSAPDMHADTLEVDLSRVESLTATFADGRAIRLLLGGKAQLQEVGTPTCARNLEAADAEPLQDGQPPETRPQGDDVRCDVCGDAMIRSEITIGGWVNFDCQNCGHVRPVQVE